MHDCLGQIEKCVFQVTGLKILNRVSTHILYFLCILKGILPFKMHKIYFFPKNLKNLDMVRLSLTQAIILFGLVDIHLL